MGKQIRATRDKQGEIYLHAVDMVEYLASTKVDPGSFAAAHLEAIMAKINEWREKA